MVRSIMVVADGSSPFQGVLDLAVRWGQRFDALVVGTGIVDQTIRGPAAVPLGAGAAKVERDEDLLERCRQEVHDELQVLDARCAEAGVTHQTVQANGRPYEEVLEHAQRYDVVLVSQPPHQDPAMGGLQHEQLERVLRSTPRPIVAVPEKLSQRGDGVLIAYDGSLQAARAVHALVASGLCSAGRTTVVSVDAESEAAARGLADRARDYLELHGIETTVKPVESDRPVGEVILEEIASQQPEILVAGAHGQSRLKEFFVGSVTAEFLRQSPVPVFLFH